MSEQREILVRRRGSAWQPPASTGYASERALQQLLAENSQLLPHVEKGARTVTEFVTSTGPLDVLVIDDEGAITIVECKLASNEESRRKIIGQVFDYAAHLWDMPLSEFEARLSARGMPRISEWLNAQALERLEQDLARGSFTLVLAVDRINAGLRRMVEYLNTEALARVTVLAVEFDIAALDDVEILIPTVYGREIAAARTSTPASRRRATWQVDDVLTWVSGRDPEVGGHLSSFIGCLGGLGAHVFGTGAQLPSLVVSIETVAGTVYPYAVYAGETKHTLAVNVAWMAKLGTPMQEAFLQDVSRVLPELDADRVRRVDYRRRPGVPLDAITRSDTREALIAAVETLPRSTVEDGSHSSSTRGAQYDWGRTEGLPQ
jgi:hypothetical protein